VSEDEQTTEPQPQRLRPAHPPEVVLAAGTQTSGELKAEGDVRVDGAFEGRIEVVGWVIVGEQARVTADIFARHVLVDGHVHGSIEAVGQVQVRPTGQVWGDIVAAEVLVDPGGAVHPAGEEPPLQPVLPLPTPAAEPEAPPVEIVWPDRHPARERMRRAEERRRRQSLQRWALGLGVAAAGVLVVCGVLALSGGLLLGASPSQTATHAQRAVQPSATPMRQFTHTPPRTATPSATRTPTATATPPPTDTSTATPPPTETATPTATPTRTPAPTATSTQTSTPPPTKMPTSAPAAASPTAMRTVSPATPTAAPTASPTSAASAYPFVPDGPVVSEYPDCAPAIVWLRGQVRNATPEQLQHVQVEIRYPDGRVLTEPVQPDGSYEARLYTQGPCPVTLIDSRDGTQLSPTVNVEYADTCNGSAFTLHWKRVET